MPTMDELQVYFCDLCDTSVPAEDLDSGDAKRIHGKVIGRCCLAQLGPSSRDGKAAAPAIPVASGSSKRAAGAPTSGGIGLLLASVLVLAGIALGVLFIDWRLGQEAELIGQRAGVLESKLREQEESVTVLATRLTSLPGAGHFESIASSVSAQTTLLESVRGELAAASRDLGERIDVVAERTDRLVAIDAEFARELDDVKRSIQEIARRVADAIELAEASSTGPVISEPSSATPASSSAAVSGMSDRVKELLPRLSSDDAGTRYQAVVDLVATGEDDIAGYLTPLADDSDLFVRRLVLEELGRFRTVESVEALIEGLEDDQVLVRQAAASSLRNLTSQSHGFDEKGSTSERRAAVGRWKKWWQANRDAF